MHMRSADYAVERCLSVRPSVRLSVTRQYSVETIIRIIKLFHRPGSHTILVFLYQTVRQIRWGHPHNGGVECKGL